ncbi:hypothetical protein L1049_008180 [Liquidambar formosana]|uniref:RNase H type-1 domain-containing protein n=1 Tax=Liquidambar formosana TaxID=63359 RepID=A0AAP0X5B3_LIQFO
MAQIMMVMWIIWNNRNGFLFEGDKLTPQQLMERATILLQEYVKAQNVLKSGGVKNSARWKPQTVGIYKVNFDGALFANKKSVGLGVEVRDVEGQPIAAASKQMDGVFPPTQVEAMAMHFAMDFVADLGLKVVIMEGDNLDVVNSINSGENDHSLVGLIIEDIQCKVNLFESVVFSHIGRIGNSMAHGLC